MRNTCYLCHYQELRQGRKRFFFFFKSASGLITSLCLNSLDYINSIIFCELYYFQNIHSSKPQKVSSLSIITNSFIPATPLRQAAECPSSAKSKEWAKKNMAEVPRRRNVLSALRKPRTGGCSMPRWDHAERAAWRHGSRTGGAGSQAKAQYHFILKRNSVLGLLSPLQVVKEYCKPAEIKHSLKETKVTEAVSV